MPGLHARISCGDLEALGELYDAHAPFVYGMALRVGGSESLAEEVTQGVFADLWRSPLAYAPEDGPLRAWLVARARHEAATRAAT